MRNSLSFILILLICNISCHENINKNLNGKKLYKENIRKIRNVASRTNKIKKKDDIFYIQNKLEKQKELSEEEYSVICDFLIQNKDESISEGLGYLLFVYLNNNNKRNKKFSLVLDNNSETKKEVLKLLIKVMCIDLVEENYTYERLINDFPIFNEGDTLLIKNTLELCFIGYGR